MELSLSAAAFGLGTFVGGSDIFIFHSHWWMSIAYFGWSPSEPIQTFTMSAGTSPCHVIYHVLSLVLHPPPACGGSQISLRRDGERPFPPPADDSVG